jgi:methylglutaconyl-CoA hydratase
MTELVTYERDGSTAVLTLNRADRRNALSRVLIAAIDDAVKRAGEDAAVRSVILTGNGPAFCAGMDLEEIRALATGTADADQTWDDAFKLSKLYDRLYTLPKPTIAAVNGPAVAGGAGLVSVCDLALAAPTAKFGYPEVRRGLVAAMVLPHLLRHVGERAARWMLLTGELIDAAEAERIGLINRVVPAADLMAAATNACRSLAEGGPKALTKTKELLDRCSAHALGVEELARGQRRAEAHGRGGPGHHGVLRQEAGPVGVVRICGVPFP